MNIYTIGLGILWWSVIPIFAIIIFVLFLCCSLIFRITHIYSKYEFDTTKHHHKILLTKIIKKNEFNQQYIDVSGVKIHCVIKEPKNVVENNKTVIFIHGTASCSVCFFNVMKQLPDDVKCIAIDLPGFGISDRIEIEDNDEINDTYLKNIKICEQYADVIGNTLRIMDINNAFLVGHSLGGMFSVCITSRFPDIISKLLLVNSAGLLPMLGIYGYYWAIFFKLGLPTTLFHIPVISNLIMPFVQFMFCDKTDLSNFWFMFYNNPENIGHNLLQRFITLNPFYSFWNTPVFMKILETTNKIYVCYGEHDTIIPSHIGRFIEEITVGRVRTHTIKNVSHNPCHDDVDAFTSYLYSICKDDDDGVCDNTTYYNKTLCNKIFKPYTSYHSFESTHESIQAQYNKLYKQIHNKNIHENQMKCIFTESTQ
jgi:pimeloyl-ACP methyl ester carboxylesterase